METQMTTQIVLKTVKDNIGIITLNNPKKCNVINPDLIYLFQEHFHALSEDSNVDVIIINGNGKHFCAGADLNHMNKMASSSESENQRDALWLSQLFELIYSASKPTICCAHGHVFGGGLGIMAASDIVIADPNSSFCFPEVKIGLIPATIAIFILQRIGYQHAKRLMLTADIFDSKYAMHIGLADKISSEDEVLNAGLKIAAQLKNNDKKAIMATKKLLNTLQPIDKDQLTQAADLLAQIRTTDTTRDKITAFLNKERARNNFDI